MKKALCLMLTFALLFNLSACSGGNKSDNSTQQEVQNNTQQEDQNNTANIPNEEDNSVLPKGTGVALTIYSNSVSDGRGDWLVERAAQDGFTIQYVDAGASTVQSRLLAEKNAPIADVTFGLNAIIWEALKAEDMFEQYVPGWADEVSAGLNDADGYYHAIVKQAILLVYDKNQMSEADAPTDWIDLWTNEEYFGKYETSIKVSGGTVRNVLAGILTRYVDPNGELSISAEGWEQIRLYFANSTPAQTDVDLYAAIASDSSPVIMGQMWSSGIASRETEYGVDTGIVVPEIGVPYAVEGVAIIKGTKNLEEAQRFVEWFGSAQIQGEWAVEFSTLPANEIAALQADEFNQYIGQLPAQDIDWSLVAENIDMWCEKIELTYIQ